jgi:anti-sigma factor RsiW
MNTEPQNFEQLRAILALKRHEVPPPRFFQDFPDKVMGRLHLQQHEEEAPLPWWQQLLPMFELRSAAVFGVFVVFGGLLVGSIILAAQQDAATQTASVSGPEHLAVTLAMDASSAALFAEVAPVVAPEETFSSTEPVITEPPSPSPFNQFNLRIQRASFTFGFGGH